LGIGAETRMGNNEVVVEWEQPSRRSTVTTSDSQPSSTTNVSTPSSGKRKSIMMMDDVSTMLPEGEHDDGFQSSPEVKRIRTK
jgi:hypothetical protein